LAKVKLSKVGKDPVWISVEVSVEQAGAFVVLNRIPERYFGIAGIDLPLPRRVLRADLWSGHRLRHKEEFANQRGMLPRHLLTTCSPEHLFAHGNHHVSDLHAGASDVLQECCRERAVPTLTV